MVQWEDVHIQDDEEGKRTTHVLISTCFLIIPGLHSICLNLICEHL